MAALVCDICGGKLMAKAGGLFECEYCGMQYDKTRIQEMVQEIKGTVKVEGTVEVKGTVKLDGPIEVKGGVNVESLLKRGWMALEDQKWSDANKAFDQVLDFEPENGWAHLGRYFSSRSIRNMSDAEYNYKFYFLDKTLADLNAVSRIRKLADPELHAWFQKMDEIIKAETRHRQEEENRKREEEEREERETYKRNCARVGPVQTQIAKAQGIIAAGSWHSVGLKTDGTVVAIGNNKFGQCDVGSWRNIIAVAAGNNHTVGLKSDGTVVAVGHNDKGQCEVASWRGIRAIAASSWHTVGLKTDGTVIAAGLNNHDSHDVREWKNIIAISTAFTHTVGLDKNGNVVVSGHQKGSQNSAQFWDKIVSVSAGQSSNAGLRPDGTVRHTNEYREADAYEWQDIVAIEEGYHCTLGLKADGTVLAAGKGMYNISENVQKWTNIVALAAADGHVLGLKRDGTVVATGNDGHGILEVSKWKLFDCFETLEQEREDVKCQRKERCDMLNVEKAALTTEFGNLKGLFTGKRRREIEARLAEIETELEGLN